MRDEPRISLGASARLIRERTRRYDAAAHLRRSERRGPFSVKRFGVLDIYSYADYSHIALSHGGRARGRSKRGDGWRVRRRRCAAADLRDHSGESPDGWCGGRCGCARKRPWRRPKPDRTRPPGRRPPVVGTNGLPTRADAEQASDTARGTPGTLGGLAALTTSSASLGAARRRGPRVRRDPGVPRPPLSHLGASRNKPKATGDPAPATIFRESSTARCFSASDASARSLPVTAGRGLLA